LDFIRACGRELCETYETIGLPGGFLETPDRSKCADWRADFLTDEGEKSKEYFVYFKILRRNQA
jgi:hypothetical protein